MRLVDIVKYFEYFGIIAGVLVTIFALSSKFRKFVKEKVDHYKIKKAAKNNVPVILDQINSKMGSIDDRLQKVEYQVSPNGNGSMRDKIALIQAEIEATIWLSPRPTFRTTSAGMNLFVNEAYSHLCNCPPDELLRLGWKSFVSDESQADDFYERWLLASKNVSQFAAKLKIQPKNAEHRGEWLVRIRPLGQITSSSENDYMWQGILYPSDEVAKNYAKTFGIPILNS